MENTAETFRPSMKNLIAYAFGAGIFFIFFANFLLAFGILGLLIAVLVFFGVIFWGYLGLKNTWIEVKNEGLLIHSGIIAKKRSLLFYSQIQDIKEAQGLLDLIIGIKKVSIVTMTGLSAQAAARLPAFRASDADRLRNVVLERVTEAEKTVSAKEAKTEAGLEKELGENPFPLQPGKTIIATVLPAAIFLTLLLVIVPIAIQSADAAVFLMLLFVAIIFVGIMVIGTAIKVYCTKYVLGKNRLEISFEFLSLSKITIPYEKIQDVIIGRGLFERMLGLSALKIETGSMEIYATKGQRQQIAMNVIPALLEKDALEIRALLTKAIGCSLEEKKPALVGEIPLEGRKPAKKTVALLPVLLVIFAVIGILAQGIALILLPCFALIVAAKYVYEIFYLKKYYYNLSADALIIRKGVFTVREAVIPFNRIQNVFVDQDIFDRIFGLWDTHVSTVTPLSGIQGHIDGLNQKNARQIADILLAKIKQK